MGASLAPTSQLSSPSPPYVSPLAPTVWLWLGAAVLLIGLLFAARFVLLAQIWWSEPNYSHGFLVPLLSGWLAWRAFRQAGPLGQGELGPGVVALGCGSFFNLAGLVLESPLLDFAALALILRGLAVCAGGRVWARAFTFPILFLFFMFPLPTVWTGAAAVALQDWVARCSAAVLDLFVVCYRRGHSLHMAGLREPLVVAAECSGLRQIVAFLSLAALVGHLNRLPWPSRTLLLLLAVPVAVIANVARVLLMAAGALQFGTGWFSGKLHDVPALITLPLGLALFALAGWGLHRMRGAPKEVTS